MQVVISIAAFGAIGCLVRYWLSGWVYDLVGRNFPYGTFAVNLLGSFCIGLLMELSLRTTLIPSNLRTGLAIGFLGGLTTFSTFSYETFKLLEDGELLIAAGNVAISILVCLLFTWLGIVAAKTLVG